MLIGILMMLVGAGLVFMDVKNKSKDD